MVRKSPRLRETWDCDSHLDKNGSRLATTGASTARWTQSEICSLPSPILRTGRTSKTLTLRKALHDATYLIQNHYFSQGDILCVQRDDRDERAQSQGAKLHSPYLHLSPPSIIFSHPPGTRHQLAPVYEASEAWLGQKRSRGWLSLRNARMGLHWPKTTDSWVHSDLEAQGLSGSVFRALVPMEINENPLYLLIKSPSHISKPRAK